MLIDDEESVRNIMEKILVRSGYTVFTAQNGVDALKKLKDHEIDLIMLDMNMPQMNGIEFLKFYRMEFRREIPVLMVTGNTDQELRLQCYNLGVYDFIGKPEDTEVMLKRIENGLKIGEMIKYNRSVRSDLMTANKLQRYLYPPQWAEMDRAEIFAWFRPVADIGGDLYDYVMLEDGRVIFFVCDVSGHGISAALFTMLVKMIFRRALGSTTSPGEIMTILNNEISGNIPVESFITMFCGCFDPVNMTVEYSNAGHPMPFLLMDDSVDELQGNGPFLGPIKNVKFITYMREVENSRALIVFSDGVMDITDDNDDEKIGKRLLLEGLGAKNLSFKDKFAKMKYNLTRDKVRINDDSSVLVLFFK